MTPSPANLSPPSPGAPTGNGGADGDATPSPAGDGSPPVAQPVEQPVGDRAAPTTVTSDSTTSSGLSTGEAVGIGVGVSAVAIVGGVALARWAKTS